MEKSKKNDSFILGNLDEQTVLLATPEAFVIKEKAPEDAEAKDKFSKYYYYAELGDAIRAYVNLFFKRPNINKQLDGDIKALINCITKLEQTIKDIGSSLNLDFAERLEDPVEAHLFTGGDNS